MAKKKIKDSDVVLLANLVDSLRNSGYSKNNAVVMACKEYPDTFKIENTAYLTGVYNRYKANKLVMSVPNTLAPPPETIYIPELIEEEFERKVENAVIKCIKSYIYEFLDKLQ